MHEIRWLARGCFVISLAIPLAAIVLLFFPASRFWGIALLVIWPSEVAVYYYLVLEKV